MVSLGGGESGAGGFWFPGAGLRAGQSAAVRTRLAVRAGLARATKRKILVLGDMGELGADAEQLHAEIGQYARAARLDGLLTLGEMSRAYAGERYDTPEQLADALRPQLDNTTTVLVKGSRFMRMERVVALITETQEKEARHAA